MLNGLGISLPSGSLVFEPRTVVVALAVGVGVTMVAAISPARRAVRVPPVAALVNNREGQGDSLRRRVTVGSVVALGGVSSLLAGLSIPAIALVGLGALAVFVGAGMLAPIVARPISSALGRPLAGLLGISGRLGRENSMRSPRRTAQTAAALMVGLALVSTIAVFGASLSKSSTSSVNNAVSADYIITSASSGAGGFSGSVAGVVSRVPGVTAVSTVFSGQFDFQRSLSSLTAVSPLNLPQTIILAVTAGRGTPALAAGQLLIDTTTANTKHLSVGSVVPVRFAQTGASTMTVGGIFKPNALLGSFVVADSFFLAHFTNPLPVAVLAKTAGASGNVGTALDNGLRAYPDLQVQTRGAFNKSQQAQVSQLLGLVYALLALAVVIALIGIVNTLMLSVFERTREIGFLRAVGMKRRQVRAMVRSESVIITVFGALVGVVIGTGLGTALAASLKQQGITDIVVPFSDLVLFLVISALLGLGAATWPARRAAKLDILAAIAAE
jgi:putative ABC transport system permease protein